MGGKNRCKNVYKVIYVMCTSSSVGGKNRCKNVYKVI